MACSLADESMISSTVCLSLSRPALARSPALPAMEVAASLTLSMMPMCGFPILFWVGRLAVFLIDALLQAASVADPPGIAPADWPRSELEVGDAFFQESVCL